MADIRIKNTAEEEKLFQHFEDLLNKGCKFRVRQINKPAPSAWFPWLFPKWVVEVVGTLECENDLDSRFYIQFSKVELPNDIG